MFIKQTVPYEKLDPLNCEKNQSKPRRLFRNGVLTWAFGMLFMFIIMSLMIVKVASTTALHQNKTQPYQLRRLQNYSLSHNDIEEAEEEEDFDDIVTSSTTISPESDNRSVILARDLTQTDTDLEGDTTAAEAVKRSNIDEMRAKLQQLQLQQQQQYEKQQYEQLQQQQQQQHLHAIAGETAYLLERADNNAHDELQPIYGTWRTKARRPQPPSTMLATTSSSSSSSAAVGALQRIASSSAVTVGVGNSQHQHESDKDHHIMHHYHHEHHHPNHLYERLPKRSVTMTPLRGEMHDQMPRPPSQTTHRPPSSALVRRQFSETPGSLAKRDDSKPKPFHFPFDGPMPEQFKKVVGERPELHNIQDILQHLHISGGGIAASKMPPQMVMMPTGLHIAGSFKNLKSSGIANFFRNKRNKKQMQLSIPIPMPMQLLGLGYQPPTSVFGAKAQPHQRIAIDQFYQFKPRSPQDVNLLAMQQQIQTNASNQKKKKQKQKKQYGASNNLLMEHPPHFVADSYLPHFPPIITLNATRPPSKLKRLPFKVNLDIYPVLPPTKDLRPFALEEASLMQPSRPVSALRNPFSEYMHSSLLPSAAALTASSPYPQPIYGPFKFPSSAQTPMQLSQSSNMHVVFPDQAGRYNQQHHHHHQQQQQQQQQQLQQQQHQQQQHQQQQHQQQQHQQQQHQQQQHQQQQHQQQQLQQQQHQQLQLQHYQQQKYPINQYQMPFLPPDHIHPPVSSIDSQSNAKSNQILVHLNVFPKHKPPTTFKPSTNPFYSNFVSRNTISEEPELQIDPRHLPETTTVGNSSYSHQQQLQQSQTQQQQHQPQNQQQQEQQLQQQRQQQQLQQNQTLVEQQQPTISRSDRLPRDELIDFNHPIVAAELPQAAALTGNRLDNSESTLYDHIDTHNNFHYNNNANIDQVASEAQTASLFRFPVEDLIQFQVDDAL